MPLGKRPDWFKADLRSYKETAGVVMTSGTVVLDLAHVWSLFDLANL